MTGCVTTPKNKIVLSPKPQREIRPEVNSLNDIGTLITYYESLIESWESWGEEVSSLIEK